MARILLLEPDLQLGTIYSKYLRDFGHKVDHCREAGHAIEVMDKADIEIVILELQIALHNGIEFLYEMRSYPEWQNIPIIINSSVPKQILEQNKLLQKHLNIAEVLYKPTTKLKMLSECVRRNLSVVQL